MKNALINTEDILSKSVSGFHQYILNEPVHLNYVSANLCDMAGVSEDELLSEKEDLYARLVHADDKETYFEFINKLKSEEQTLTCEYRIVRKDGTVIYVSDTVVSKKSADGTLTGDSVLTDITEIKSQNDNLRFLNETIPCGFIKYTCEKQPKVTYINKKMMELLRFPEAKATETDYLDMYKDNIFLMIPIEERRRFSLYLERVYRAGATLAGEMTLIRCDGARVYVFGWVTKCVNEDGVEEFQSVCMDITQRYQLKKANETKRYLKALTDVYDKIFEYDFHLNTVKCLYSNNSPAFKWLENVPMQMADATERWIADTVASEDCDKLRHFFKNFAHQKLYSSDEKPPQVTYRARSSSGEMKLYRGIFLKMNESVNLYCCRCVPASEEAELLRSEYDSLKENMQELVMRFTDGAAAFEIKDEFVTPLYASDNICEFFGFLKEEWLTLMQKGTPIEDFIARSRADTVKIAELLKNGEAEFAYFDIKSQTEQKIKAICSQKSPSGSHARYIMLYNVKSEAADMDKAIRQPLVSIRTFGYFDVFVGDKPIAFRNKKSKELFALLTDRRGGYVSSQEAIGFLWEDEPVNSVTLARYRKVALRLKNILEEYGISDVIETVDGKRRVVKEKVRCDLYDYLSGSEEYAQLFKGSYLTNYSWGENTLAELMGNSF